MIKSQGWLAASVIAIAASVCIVVGVCHIGASEYRFWTSNQGQRSDVKLQLLEQDDERIRLKREDDGRVVELPISRLSQEDRTYLRGLAAVDAGNSTTSASSATNWPRFRGPDGSGVSGETGLPVTWSAAENIAWKAELPGPGTSSPIVFGDHVYVTCHSGYGVSAQSPGDPAALTRHLICLNRNSGEILWDEQLLSEAAEQPYAEMMLKHGYTSSTPVADEEGVYVYYGTGGAAAYTHGGRRVWHRSCGTNVNNYGSASSPIVIDNMLIVDASVESPGYPGSASLLALDKQTGEEIWKQTSIGAGGYMTPTVVEVNGTRELIVGQPWGSAVVGADLKTGQKLWHCGVSIHAATPVADEDGNIYILSKNGYAAVRTGGRGDVTETHRLWEVKRGRYRLSSPIYWEGHLYWMPMDGGIAYCADAKTGELVYEQRINPPTGQIYASPVLADGRIYYVTREGGTYVVPAKPEYELLAHNTIESNDSIFNASPAISGGKIFLRSDKFVYCIGSN